MNFKFIILVFFSSIVLIKLNNSLDISTFKNIILILLIICLITTILNIQEIKSNGNLKILSISIPSNIISFYYGIEYYDTYKLVSMLGTISTVVFVIVNFFVIIFYLAEKEDDDKKILKLLLEKYNYKEKPKLYQEWENLKKEIEISKDIKKNAKKIFLKHYEKNTKIYRRTFKY